MKKSNLIIFNALISFIGVTVALLLMKVIQDKVLLVIILCIVVPLFTGLISTNYIHGLKNIRKFTIVPMLYKSDNDVMKFKKLTVLKFILLFSLILNLILFINCIYFPSNFNKILFMSLLSFYFIFGFFSLLLVIKKLNKLNKPASPAKD